MFIRHTAGADFPYYDPLGPGIIHPEPWACAHDVQPPSQAVRRAGRAHAGPPQGLHHQCGINSGHYGPAGVPGTDPLTAYCPDGSRGREAYDSKHRVDIRFIDLEIFLLKWILSIIFYWGCRVTYFFFPSGTSWVTKFSTSTPTWCERWACMKL